MPKEVSLAMTVVLVFITHTVVNTCMLLPWNPIRCSFWNLYECSIDENWMLNWLTYSRFHLVTLLVCLAKSSMGNYLLEQRLLVLCSLLMFNFMSTGIFTINLINKSMAALQCMVYAVLLLIALHHLTTSEVIPLPSQLKSTSFDMRRRLPIASVALGIQYLLSVLRVSEMTFGEGHKGYMGDTSSAVYQIMSSAAVNDMFVASLILGVYFLTGTIQQQKALLVGQILVLFVSQLLLAGSQGERIAVEQAKAGGVATFFSLVISLLGMA